uniref:UDP-N-acetylglucosamine 1-carboxyvinyltransferase n=2 Tax=Anthurium amnicola TaxID=1678845 RepID=A0A1D1YRU6_9ARAE
MVAAAITRSCISLSPIIPHHLSSAIEKLSAAGCKIRQPSDGILEVSAVHEAVGELHGLYVKTSPFPGFPTDLQPQFMSLLTTCNGMSTVEESIFERRMRHVEELQKLGARIQLFGRTAVVMGNERRGLSGTQVMATDLRSGASLVLAGLAAEGITEVASVGHVDRGYENLEGKLRDIGADITRVLDPVGNAAVRIV